MLPFITAAIKQTHPAARSLQPIQERSIYNMAAPGTLLQIKYIQLQHLNNLINTFILICITKSNLTKIHYSKRRPEGAPRVFAAR